MFARGDHTSLEHLLFTGLRLPIQASLLVVWTFRLLTAPKGKEPKTEEHKVKSESSNVLLDSYSFLKLKVVNPKTLD